MFDVNQSLIRHWEAKFDCLHPHKNKRGNRMFSTEDVEKLKQIYHLVKEQGMTLDGARRVMRGASGKELARQTELLERLQRIRAALVEVREELKLGEGESLVESVGAELREIEAEVMALNGPEVASAQSTEEPKRKKSVTVKSVADDAQNDTVEDGTVVSDAASVAEQPSAKRVRRRKKSDDENKELFPFYEQSLF